MARKVEKAVKTKRAKPVKSVQDVPASSKAVAKKYFTGKYFLILVLSGVLMLLVISLYFLDKRINVAKVNGQPITRMELYKELEKKDAKAVLDEIITKKIILQEAKKQGISVSQEDINAELSKINESVTKQGATLNEVLDMQGVSYEQLIENIKIQKILEQILKGEITVTDGEVKAQYDQNKDVYGKEKTFEDLKEDIRFQLYRERITTAYRKWIEEKRNSSKVENYL